MTVKHAVVVDRRELQVVELGKAGSPLAKDRFGDAKRGELRDRGPDPDSGGIRELGRKDRARLQRWQLDAALE